MSFGNNTFGQPNSQETAAAPMFAQPASTTGLDLNANEGALLMFKPTGIKEGISTTFGTSDAVETNVVILDGPNAGEKLNDVLIFPKVLQSQLKKHIDTGMIVLGRLGKGVAKQGQSAPWTLSDSTPDDQQAAQSWINQNAGNDSDAPF